MDKGYRLIFMRTSQWDNVVLISPLVVKSVVAPTLLPEANLSLLEVLVRPQPDGSGYVLCQLVEGFSPPLVMSAWVLLWLASQGPGRRLQPWFKAC